MTTPTNLPRTPGRFPDGSTTGHHMDAACLRAVDALMNLSRKADRLIDLMDNVTAPGVIRTQMTDEDSLVIAIRDMTSHHGDT